jgi:hypothetical protein
MTTPLDEKLRKVIADGEALASLADRAMPIAKDLLLDSRVKTTADLATRARDRNFQIIFAGEFNSGKSTAINALLGEPVMPMKVVEANAILTKIRYGHEKHAVLYPADGSNAIKVPYREFAQHIVVDRKDRKRPSRWEYAELFFPLELLQQGIVIVDPPGTNALPERQARTVDEAANSDAAVFLFFANQPFKESERNFIVGCLDGKECFWLVAHADILDAEGLAEVREDLEGNLFETRPHDATIPSRMFFVNARQAQKATAVRNDSEFTASGMNEFVQALGNFISGDRHRAKMQDLCTRLTENIHALDQAAESQQRDTEREHDDVVRRHEKLKVELEAARKEADGAAFRLTSRISPLAETVRRMVRAKIRSIPGDPPFDSSDLVLTDTTTFSMDFGLQKERKEHIIEEVRGQVVRMVQQELRDWFRGEVSREITDGMETELNTFDKAREVFEARLAAIRDEYLGLPPSKPGHKPAVPDLEASRFPAVISRTVRSVTGALQVPTRTMRLSFHTWRDTPYDDSGGGTWKQARKVASETFAGIVARMVVEQIAEMADDLADAAQDEMRSWSATVEGAALKSISDPRLDLEKTAQEGERASRLQVQEKHARRAQLTAHRKELSALGQELSVLHARYVTR